MIRDIALAYGDDPALRAGLQRHQIRALEDIAACGTAAMGLHEEICDACGDRRLTPNTCGNRHCPHCQGRVRAEWVEDRTDELLPVGYFHVVLTLPPDLRALATTFPRVVLGAMMQAAPDVIATLCRDAKHLGAEVGQLAVLHTWKRDLGWHPHVHLIVTAGGWDDRHHRWIPANTYGSAKKPFLLPAAVLRAAFQRQMRTLLLRAYRQGRFSDGPSTGFPELADLAAFTARLDQSIAKAWVLRIEPPFGGPIHVLKYLGAYVGRVAISPSRITAHDPKAATVTYIWTTNAEPDKPQEATIPATEFLLRFLQHVLPPRFQRIRFRGLWSTAHRETKLRLVQRHLKARAIPPAPPLVSPPSPDPRYRCTCCGIGTYQRTPGPCPRPSAQVRRRLLTAIREGLRTQVPQEATTTA